MKIKKERKIRLLFRSMLWLICAALLSCNIFFTSFANTPSTVELNYSQRFPRILHIEGNKISIEQIPLIPQFNYVWMILKDKNGQKVYSETYRNTSGNLYYTLNDVSDGRYSLEVYIAPEEYTTYKGIIFGKNVEVILQNGNASFIQYPYYEHNVEVFNNKRTDEKALSIMVS